jgi:hypothetical protein
MGLSKPTNGSSSQVTLRYSASINKKNLKNIRGDFLQSISSESTNF